MAPNHFSQLLKEYFLHFFLLNHHFKMPTFVIEFFLNFIQPKYNPNIILIIMKYLICIFLINNHSTKKNLI